MANWGVNCRMKVSSPTFLVGSGTFTFVSYKLIHSSQFYKLLWGVCKLCQLERGAPAGIN